VTVRRNGKPSVLLVTQYAPPSSLVAARRVAAMAKYLGRAGHAMTVLTSIASGSGEIEGAEVVVRTRDALTSRLNWRRRQFAALAGGSAESYKPPSRLASVIVPDLSLATWLPFSLPAALRLARRRRFDCVLTTSPPPSVHLIGLALRRSGIPWIAELRDGWTFEPPHAPWPLRLQHQVDRRLEGQVLRHADAVIGVTRPIVEDIRARLGVDAELVTNGYDPEDVLPAPEALDMLLNANRHSLVHTGRLSLSGISLRPLLEAVRITRTEDPEVARRLEVVFAGSLTEEERRLLAAPDLTDTIRFVGWLERPRALALQQAADTLLILTEGVGRGSVATGKVFEYIAAGQPILVLGKETEAARIVTETGSGFAAPALDPRAISAALRHVVLEPAPPVSPVVARQYAYPVLADRLAAVIERVALHGGA
jgi:glycosyltransferase involved in cell wall biosynthesis